MLDNIIGDCWLGAVDEYIGLSSNQTDEGMLVKILCECQNGDFSNVVSILDIALNSSNPDVWEACFKLFMTTSTHSQIKNRMDTINELLEKCMQKNMELVFVDRLAQHIPLCFSGQIITEHSNFVRFYLDLVDSDLVDGILLAIEFMFGINIYDGEDNIQDALANIPTEYIFDGAVLDINTLAEDLLADIHELEEDLIIVLAIATGVTPPDFENDTPDIEKLATEFLTTIKEKNFVKGKKYFYGYEIV